MNETNQEMLSPTATPEPRRYSTAESLFAWICLLTGYLLCRLIPVTASPLGGFLLILGLFAVTLIVLYLKGCTCSVGAWCAAGSAVVVSAALLFCADPLLHRISFWYAIAAYAYVVYAAAGNTSHGLSDTVLTDTFKAAVIMPFCAKANLFAALFSGKAKNSGKAVAKLLLGLLLAVIPTAVVLGLLSYDNEFSALLSALFAFDAADIVSHVASAVFGIPIGMYLFGMLIADTDREAADVLTPEDCRDIAAKCRIVSPLTVAAATLPLLAVYIIFFISQRRYYLAGFTGELPEGFNHASFAREGFFQLCTVAVINLGMILLAMAVTKRSDNRPSVILSILTPLYSVATLVLIATAIAKMGMYIASYGLTPKRVYATWFMLLIAAVFVLIVVGRFVPRMKTVLVCTAVCVVMFAGLSLCNVGGMIADYNVDRYLSGDLKTVDIEALDTLGDAAVPALCRLYEHYEERGNTTHTKYFQMTAALRDAASELEDKDVWSFTIPQVNAVSALRDVGMME